jgi:predicted Fe-Mo cluster-binding NifX family protein
MRIAISTDGEHVSQHFGRCPYFTIIELEEEEIKSKEIVNNPGHHPGFIPKFLHEKGIDCIITGGMGKRAMGLFKEYGIETVVGVTGTVKETLKKLKNGSLEGKESLCKPGAGKGYGIEKTENRRVPKKMKICVTSQGDNLNAEIDPRFGRAVYFLFVNADNMENESIKNPYMQAGGGAGIQAAQFVANKNVGVVITGNIGPNSFQVLKEAGLEIISGVSGDVKTAIEKYNNGELKSIEKPTVDEKFGI